MKVLFVFGTIPLYMSTLLKKIVEKGVEVVVLRPSNEHSRSVGKGVKASVQTTDYRIVYEPESVAWYGKPRIENLSRILHTERPDIVVVGWPYFLQLFFDKTIMASIKKHNIKLIIREIPFQTPPFGQLFSYFRKHPVYDENMNRLNKGLVFYFKALLTMYIRKWCYSKADGTLNYTTYAKEIIPSYGVDDSSIHITYNANNDEELRAIREKALTDEKLLPDNKQRILHIGRLVKWKRVDLLIEAFALVLKRFPHAELVIVGDGPELEPLKELAKTHRVDTRVVFAGAVYGSYDLGRYMLESSIYVLAGMGGLSINDAMTFGLPVICSVCDGTEKDLVIEGKNGHFFRPGDATDLAEKITGLFLHPEVMEAMGEESERIIREKINIEIVSSRFIKAFQAVSGK